MKKIIVIGCLIAVSLLVMMPNISAINVNLGAKSPKSENLEQIDNYEQKRLLDNPIWGILSTYIQMMYHLRMARADFWDLLGAIPGVPGTLLPLIELRAYLLSTRATVSRDVLTAILDALQDIIPLKG